MTGRVQKLRPMPDMSENSSLERMKRTKNSIVRASVEDTLSDSGMYVLLFSAFTAVRRAALCLQIMSSCPHRRCPRMLKQTVLSKRYST